MKNNGRPALWRLTKMLIMACSLALCQSGAAHAATSKVSPDPLEGMNRAFFSIHQFLDRIILRPAAIGYKRIIPRPIRTGLGNAVSNLSEPNVAVNDLLQGHGKKAAKTFARFAGNTTLGVFGLFDVATPAGLPHHSNDFGLTLGRLGVKPGPYLFIPLVGPTTVRDGVGKAAGFVLNPLIYARYPDDEIVAVTSVVAGGLGVRAAADSNLKALQASSTDMYASIRSYYLQNRQSEITGGKLDIQALPDFDDPAPAPPAATPAATPPGGHAAAPAAPGSDATPTPQTAPQPALETTPEAPPAPSPPHAPGFASEP